MCRAPRDRFENSKSGKLNAELAKSSAEGMNQIAQLLKSLDAVLGNVIYLDGNQKLRGLSVEVFVPMGIP